MKTQLVNPPFIYTGMLVWIELEIKGDNPQSIDALCEILTIKDKTVEVCDMQTRTCFWVTYDKVFVKITGTPRVMIIPNSPFHKIL